MLVALTTKGESFICTSDLSRAYLKQLRINEQFFCPQCKREVQLKVGEIMIPHFAHLTKNSCDQLFSEGESEQHLLGKQQLYQMFQRLGVQVELESYLKDIAQRPDLLVTDSKGRKFAIEFQCSPISLERLRERTNGYLSIQVTPIWIFLTPEKQMTSASKIRRLSISTTLQHVKRGRDAYSPYIITYSPSQQTFHYFSHLLYLHDHQFISKCLQLPIWQQQFPFYEPAPLAQQDILCYVQLYNQYRNQFAYVKMKTNKQGVNDPFLRACYELRFNSRALPYYVGIPVPSAAAVPFFTAEWQVRLLYYCWLQRKGLQAFTLADVNAFIRYLQQPISYDFQQAVLEYIAYFKQALEKPLSLEDYLANQLQSRIKLEKI